MKYSEVRDNDDVMYFIQHFQYSPRTCYYDYSWDLLRFEERQCQVTFTGAYDYVIMGHSDEPLC